MLSRQHLYNGLARPVDYSFSTGMGSPAQTAWLDRQLDGQGENTMPLLLA